jgi:hypothetical protein
MHPPSRLTSAAVALILIAGAEAGAKGRTVRVTISGAQLPAPVDVTAGTGLANVWAGDFIGRPVVEPARELPRYEVYFYVEWPGSDNKGRSEPRLAYVVVFCFDPVAGVGYLYLPARRERWYALNVRTILRGTEGRWYYASASWTEAIATELKRLR